MGQVDLKQRAKNSLKRVRAIKPLNFTATRSLRAMSEVGLLPVDRFAKYLPPVGVIESELPNGRRLKMISEADERDDQVARVVYWKGWTAYQPGTTRVFFKLAQESDCTLDIGAHVGFYTLLAAHANLAGQVYAFEPLPRAFQRLAKNVRLNNLPHVRCEPVAVASESTSLDFFHVKDGYGFPSSSSLSEDFMKTSLPPHMLTTTQVSVIKIDQFVEQHSLGTVDLIKIDTESTEPEVLGGMPATLARHHPDIICEVLPGRGTEKKLEEILKPLGYRFYSIESSSLRHQKSIVGGKNESRDFLFTTRDPESIETVGLEL